MKAAVATAAFAALAISLAGCGGESGMQAAAWGGTIDTLETGVVVVNNPAEPLQAGDDAWRLEEELSIGVLEGGADYQFGSIRDIEVGDDGLIYVIDGQAKRVAIYDPTGAFVAAFGREGEGPGEFQNPGRMTWKGDTLVIWDWRLRRLSYFDRLGNLIRDHRPELPFSVGRFSYRPDGRLWAQRGPAYFMPPRPEVDGTGWLVLLDLAAESADTILRWEENSSFSVRTENFMTVQPRPYAPQLEWTAARDGRVYVGRGTEYAIDVYAPDGERVRTLTRLHTRHPPSQVEIDSVSAELEARLEEQYDPPMADRIRKAFEISELKPATGQLIVSDDGYLWVRTYSENDSQRTLWDVFDPEGRYLTQVALPVRFTIHRITSDALYGSFRDEYDVPYVKRYVRAGTPTEADN